MVVLLLRNGGVGGANMRWRGLGEHMVFAEESGEFNGRMLDSCVCLVLNLNDQGGRVD